MNAKQFLEQWIAQMPAVAGIMMRFVLEHGQEYKPAKLPKGFRKMTPKFCFSNCHYLADTRKLTYIEGFGIMKQVAMPILHAWCVRPGSLDVIEPTCDNFDSYFGIAFQTDFRRGYVRAYPDNQSLLDNWQADFPVLNAPKSEHAKMFLSN